MEGLGIRNKLDRRKNINTNKLPYSRKWYKPVMFGCNDTINATGFDDTL